MRRRSTTSSGSSGIRAGIDVSDRTLEYKIREAQMQKVPYMIILGKKEQDAKTVTIRDRSRKAEARDQA